jgi:predicted nucleotidyltransferase
MLKEKPLRVFLVGSFASGRQHQESDIDILLEVRKRSYSSDQLEEKYRTKIKSYFMKNNIREKNDSIHPQIRGRRVDVYFTYDADLETRPKIQLY